jgi:hypothetical protein
MLTPTPTRTTGRFITIGGIKAVGFAKKSEAPVEPFFLVLRAFLMGVGEDMGCWRWFFGGDFVVDAW